MPVNPFGFRPLVAIISRAVQMPKRSYSIGVSIPIILGRFLLAIRSIMRTGTGKTIRRRILSWLHDQNMHGSIWLNAWQPRKDWPVRKKVFSRHKKLPRLGMHQQKGQHGMHTIVESNG